MNAPEIVPVWWEVGKAVLLFAITGMLGFVAKDFRWMRDKVIDHDVAIYGRDGQNGLRRGLKAATDRVDLIEDRNIAVDAAAQAEQDDYRGPERRHAALHKIVEMVAAELRREKAEREGKAG